MSVIIVPIGTQYIKKEDASEFFKNHIKSQIIVGIAYSFLPLFFILFLAGRISQNLSSQFSSVNLYLFTGTLLLMIGPILFWIFIAKSFSQTYKNEFFRKIEKFDNKEMINWNKIVDTKRYFIGIGLYIACFILGLLFYFLPIIWFTK